MNNRMVPKSLKSKMTLTVFLLVTGLLSSVAFVTYLYFAKQFKKSISEQQVTLITQLAEQLDDKILTAKEQISNSAKGINPANLHDAAKMQRFLDHEAGLRSFFDTGMLLVSKDGELLAESPYYAGRRGKDYTFRDYVAITLKTGRPCISKPYLTSVPTYHPSITFAVPVFGADGRVAAVLAGRHDLLSDNFLGKLADARIGKTGYLYLFNPERTFIMHPDRQRILETVPVGANQGYERALNGFEGTLENTNSLGVRGLTSFKRLHSAEWYLAAHYPLQEAYAPLYAAKRYFYLVLVLAVSFSTVVVWLAMKKLTAPLVTFTSHITQMPGKQGAERFVAVDTGDEIGALANAFNGMVAELEKQQETLQKNAETYAIVAQFATELAAWRAPDNSILYISANCREITGYADSEFYREPELLDRLVHPNDRELWLHHTDKAGEDGAYEPIDFRIFTKDGEVRWLSHSCHSVTNNRGEFLGVRGSFRDISERKEMEEQLWEEKEFAENLINHAVVPIFVVDPQHRVIIWNKACEELTGVAAAEVVGTGDQWKPFYDHQRPTLSDLIVNDAVKDMADFYPICAKSDPIADSLQGEGWFKNLGGRDRYVSFDAASVRNGKGELIAVIETLQDITARKQAEEELRKLSIAVEQSPASIVITDKAGTIEYVNPRFSQITGYTREEAIGQNPRLLKSGKTTPTVYAELWQTITSGREWQGEFYNKKKNGEFFWESATISPITDAAGAITHFMGIKEDVTARKQAEELLHAEQQRLFAVLDGLPGFVYLQAPDYSIRFANRYFRERFGEVEGKSCYQLIYNRDNPCETCPTFRVFETNELLIWDWTGKDGRSYQVYDYPYTDIDGSPLVLEMGIDITEQKSAERNLRKSRAELIAKHEELKAIFLQVEAAKKEWERTMDCIGDMLMQVDSEGKIKRCNKAVQEFSGCSYQEVLGRNWTEFLDEHGLKPQLFFSSGMELYHEASMRWFVFNSYPYTESADFEISGIVITILNITELKRTVAKLDSAYTELKATHSQLLQNEKMASIGQLAAGVAHEINNPIGFVSSNLGTLDKYVTRLTDFIALQKEKLATLGTPALLDELAEKGKALKLDYITADAKQLIRESLEGTERVRQIVQDLKTFSRVDEAEYKHADINDCLKSTINIVWNELKYKATLNKELGEIPQTKCYPQQLNQVFMNLLVNAAHAIEKQGEITVRTWLDAGFINVSVSDTGCGIPAANLSRIFEPFYTTKEVGKGTGLGLSISYDIVKKHGGEIQVCSEVGKGTTFAVKIPVVEGR